MSEAINLSLQITLVGMGLVFGAILLLWAVMAGLVGLTADKTTAAVEEAGDDGLSDETLSASVAGSGPAVPAVDEMERKRQAAAAAVAVALAQLAEKNEPHAFPLPQTAIVSAWQSVMRARIHNKRGPTR